MSPRAEVISLLFHVYKILGLKCEILSRGSEIQIQVDEISNDFSWHLPG